VFGMVGLLGLGHMYGGRSSRGVVLMVSWWIALAILVVPGLRHITLLGVIWSLGLMSLVCWLSGKWIMSDLQDEIVRRS
jgi:hypothetical protein